MSETCGFEIAAAANADWLSAAADFLFYFHAPHSSKYIHPLHRNSIHCITSVWSSVMDPDPNSRNNRRKRQASLYDAVAGRVGYEGFLGEDPPTKNRDTVSRSNIAVPPEEVLFRRRGAPIRYEEDDIYSADRHLQPHQRLPDSDLLKTIHAYASDFYANATSNGGKSDWKSLDETALLAMGILLEEAAVEALGKTGDLALIEAAAHDDDRPSRADRSGRQIGKTLKRGVVERSQSARSRASQSRSRSRSVKRQRSGSLASTRSSRSDT
jgi:hypothetical protein